MEGMQSAEQLLSMGGQALNTGLKVSETVLLRIVGPAAARTAAFLLAMLQKLMGRTDSQLRPGEVVMRDLIAHTQQGDRLETAVIPTGQKETVAKAAKKNGLIFAAVDHPDGTTSLLFSESVAPAWAAVLQDTQATMLDAQTTTIEAVSEQEAGLLQENDHSADALVPAPAAEVGLTQYKNQLSVIATYEGSLGNQKLIAAQRPDATLVMSEAQFAKLGREVTPDAKPIIVKRPVQHVDGRTTYREANVYDVRDTTGKPLPTATLTAASPQLDQRLYEIEQAVPCEVLYSKDAKAPMYDMKTERVTLPSSLRENKMGRYYALLQNGALAQEHKLNGANFSVEQAQLTAASTTFIVATKDGADTSGINFSSYDAVGSKSREGAVTAARRNAKYFAAPEKDGKAQGRQSVTRTTTRVAPVKSAQPTRAAKSAQSALSKKPAMPKGRGGR